MSNIRTIADISVLQKLTQLSSLYLSSNQISDISVLQKLTQLSSLDLSSNQISDISVLQKLTQLSSLDLRSNQISDISVLQKLTQLSSLDLRSNQISDISVLQKLTQLSSLDLSSNQISDISVLQKLTQLSSLDLSSNQISDISVLQKLTQLSSLYLSSNQISDISVLQKLTQLSSLDLRSNQISDISVLQKLTQLSSLYLHSNQISDISVLQKLTQLSSLDLRSNQISDISVLQKLTQLSSLHLSGNQISDISVLQKLTQLSSLDLSSNQISDIRPLVPLIQKGVPLVVRDYHSSNTISLYDNPLEIPPLSVVEKGNDAVLRYLEEFGKGEGKIHEAKLLIVGEGGAGKTTLMKKLLNPDCALEEEKSTIGVNVETWTFAPPQAPDVNFTAHIWDFGGQEIQYLTHQFFLTPRSLYALVADNRKEDTRYLYWFQIIQLLGRHEKTKEQSPILILQNKKGGNPVKNFDAHRYIKRFADLDIKLLDADFSKNNHELQSIRTTIQEKLYDLPHIGQPLAASWVAVRKTIEQLVESTGKNHISFQEFAALCRKEGIEQEESQLDLSDYLHTIGIILHYPKSSALFDFVILNPEWALDAVYSILKDEHVQNNKGEFTERDMNLIWRSKYSQAEQAKLIQLMQKDNFEVCYKTTKNGKVCYVAPQLLETQTPKYDWNSQEALKFQFRYKFMPKGIVTRLIVRLHEQIHMVRQEKIVWEKGVLLDIDDCVVQVVEDKTTDGVDVINIEVCGADEEKKYALREVRKAIEKIHRDHFRNVSYSEMLPCVCAECLHSAAPHLFKLEEVQKYQQLRETEIRCSLNSKLAKVPVQLLLEGVYEPRELRQKEDRDWRERTPPNPSRFTHSDTTSTPVKEEVKEKETPFYKKWWFISLAAGFGGFVTAFIAALFFDLETKYALLVSLGASVATAGFVWRLNPKLRIFHVGTYLLSVFAASILLPFIEFALDANGKYQDHAIWKNVLKLKFDENPWISVACLIGGCFLIWIHVHYIRKND